MYMPGGRSVGSTLTKRFEGVLPIIGVAEIHPVVVLRYPIFASYDAEPALAARKIFCGAGCIVGPVALYCRDVALRSRVSDIAGCACKPAPAIKECSTATRRHKSGS